MTGIKHIVSIAAIKDGKLLFGLRRDSGKWNMPGGHVNVGETLEAAAGRELKEETDLEPKGGSIQRVGFCDVRPGLRVHTFVCVVDGTPDSSKDPDEEIHAFKWVDPKSLPKKILSNLHNKKDVTLQFLGIQDRDLELIWDEDDGGDHDGRRKLAELTKALADDAAQEKPIKKAAKVWRSRDGVTIPVDGTPERQDWDQKYHQQLVQVFANGRPEALKPLVIDPNDPSITGCNLAVNKDRLNLYRRMARGGDRLPPVIVRRSGQGFTLIDGNHRQVAGQEAGLKGMEAFEIVPLAPPPGPERPKKPGTAKITGRRVAIRKNDSEHLAAEAHDAPEPEGMSLDEMANHPDPNVRYHACKPGNGPKWHHLEKLVEDPHPVVRQRAKKTIMEKIKVGAPHREFWLNHRSFTPHDITKLLRGNDDPRMRSFAGSDSADPNLATALLAHHHFGKLPVEHEIAALDHDATCEMIAGTLKTPEAADHCINSEKLHVIRAMAKNPNNDYASRAVDWILNNVARIAPYDHGGHLREGVLESPAVNDDQIRRAFKIAQEGDKYSVRHLATSAKRLPIDLHEHLALKHPEATVRVAALERNDTPESVLIQSLGDLEPTYSTKHSSTIYPATAAVHHPNFGLEGQMKVLNGQHQGLKISMLKGRRPELGLHPQVIKAALLANDIVDAEDLIKAKQPGLNHDVAEFAATHTDPYVRRTIAARGIEHLSHETRVKLAQDEDENVREALIENTGPQGLTDEDVRAIATQTSHPGMARKILHKKSLRERLGLPVIQQIATTHPLPDVRSVYYANLLYGNYPEMAGDPERALARQALEDRSPEVQAQGLRHWSIGPDTLAKYLTPDLTPHLAHALAANDNLTPDQLHQLVNMELKMGTPIMKELVAELAAKHKNTRTDTLDQLIAAHEGDRTTPGGRDPMRQAVGTGGSKAVVINALQHPRVNLDTVRRLAADETHPASPTARKVLQVHDPDMAFKTHVMVGLGTNKLRKIRDLVQAADKPQHKNNFRQFGIDLTPFCKPGTAFVDPEKVQAAIDQRPTLRYNVSHTTWDGTQRHNGEDSHVFQLNLSTDIVNKLKAAGVYETFKHMQEASHASGHPIHKDHGLGWVRYTQYGDPTGTVKCENCNGEGYTEPEESEEECSDCDGHGRIDNECYECEGSAKTKTECDDCNGHGETYPELNADDPVKCETCDGKGEVETDCPRCDGNGSIEDECPTCDGRGNVTVERESERCYECRGQGKVDREAPHGVSADKDHFFIDEVQSDFGQDFGRTILTNTRLELIRRGEEQGLAGPALDAYVNSQMADAEEEAKKYPADHSKKISEILFHGKHSNEILYEAFLQHLRDQGCAGSQVRVHSIDSKAPISLGETTPSMKWIDPKTNKRIDVDEKGSALRQGDYTKEEWAAKQAQWAAQGYKQVRDIPAHFLHTYEQIPSKLLGWVEQKYGTGPNETGHEDDDGDEHPMQHLDGVRIWGDKLYKFEVSDAPDWQELLGLQELDQWLAKATRTEDFKGIARASTPDGARLVDHKPQMQAHPPGMNAAVEHYQNEVLAGPQIYRRKTQDAKARKAGITRKLVYETSHAGGSKFMVKPYHEAVIRRCNSWQRFPIQGWAEMANQAIYHAAGIGHLHQQVHVAEHDMGPGHEKSPALVVHMAKGFVPIAEATRTIRHPNLPFATEERIEPTDDAKKDARKIAVMDFLTNNLDRHGGNLMISEDGSRLLAVDHSRSFQYANNHLYKWNTWAGVKRIRDMHDVFGDYCDAGHDSAVGYVDPHRRDFDGDMQRRDHYLPTFAWWGTNSTKIKSAMYQQLEAIKDPTVRAHIRRNFDERARWLDERAKFGLQNFGEDWHNDHVPQYHPDQITDEEKEAARVARLQAEYQAEQAGVNP